jgi:hypothetical protein
MQTESLSKSVLTSMHQQHGGAVLELEEVNDKRIMDYHPAQVVAGITQVAVMVATAQVEVPRIMVVLPMVMAVKQAQPEAISPPLQET